MTKTNNPWDNFGPIKLDCATEYKMRTLSHDNNYRKNSEEEWRNNGLKSDSAFSDFEAKYSKWRSE